MQRRQFTARTLQVFYLCGDQCRIVDMLIQGYKLRVALDMLVNSAAHILPTQYFYIRGIHPSCVKLSYYLVSMTILPP